MLEEIRRDGENDITVSFTICAAARLVSQEEYHPWENKKCAFG
jgi:hypothetical protein